jgi:hypothetical protein
MKVYYLNIHAITIMPPLPPYVGSEITTFYAIVHSSCIYSARYLLAPNEK